MKIWYDITNTPQVHFLLAVESIIREVCPNAETIYTAREFAETTKMLAKRVGNDNFTAIGGHYGKSYIRKIYGLFIRFIQVKCHKIDYDVSVSCGSESAIWKAWMERKVSIAFCDNDQCRQWTHGHFVTHAFFPNAIDTALLEKQGLKGKLYQYNGYKEDLYLADYQPNEHFLDTIPFKEYVVVRPENVQANYIRNGKVQSITPELLRLLTENGYNVLYLPRYQTDRDYAKGLQNIYIPDAPINGLDASYYAQAVLTGAGTFAREAACLGVPSFSFFAGKDLLAVDKKMIADGKMYFSRNAQDLFEHFLKAKKTTPDLSRCKQTRDEVKRELQRILA